MGKAEQVFEKLAISGKLILQSAKKSKKVVDKITRGTYREKYNSFAQRDKDFKYFIRKLKQRDMLQELAKRVI